MDNFKIPLGQAVEAVINFLTDNLSFLTRGIAAVLDLGISFIIEILSYPHASIMIILAGLSVWRLTTKKLAISTVLGLLFIWNLGYWEPTISTISLVLFATSLSILLGVPLGIIAAINDKFNKIITPVLDFMQTMPAFVYLIPAIPFFGLGKVSAVFATIIFAIPPCIRLTSLGIRQVPKELVEAADAFGATPKQKLIKVQLPISIPTIMAGINQTIMLSLSMVVIAAMIGAKGLGGVVWKAIQRLKPGMGFEAGICIVIIAIILDRITKDLTNQKTKKY